MKTKQTAQRGAPLMLSPEIRTEIQEWNQIRSWLEKGKAREMELRRKFVALFVPKPKEGTNHIQGDGFAVKVVHKVTRNLDEAALDSVMPQLPEELRVVGTLIYYKPAFNKDVYNTLSDADKKTFEQALTIKEDGAPTLEIILSEVAERPDNAAPGEQVQPAQLPASKFVRKPRAKAAPAKPVSKKPPHKKPANGAKAVVKFLARTAPKKPVVKAKKPGKRR